MTAVPYQWSLEFLLVTLVPFSNLLPFPGEMIWSENGVISPIFEKSLERSCWLPLEILTGSGIIKDHLKFISLEDLKKIALFCRVADNLCNPSRGLYKCSVTVIIKWARARECRCWCMRIGAILKQIISWFFVFSISLFLSSENTHLWSYGYPDDWRSNRNTNRALILFQVLF